MAGIATSPVGDLGRADADSDSAWDHVYGDPGPANYSRYQDVAVTPDGGSYMAGFYSGTFNGLSSPDAYRYFLQRFDVNGAVLWTVEINTSALPTQSLPAAPELIVDGNGAPFVAARGQWYAYDASGGVAQTMAAPCCWNAPQAARPAPFVPANNGGFVAIVKDDAARLERRGADLGLIWQFDLSALIDSPTSCAFCPAAIPSVTAVSDGSFWVVGKKSRALVTQQDALSLVHISATGAQLDASKHFGITPASTSYADPIIATSTSFIWVSVQSTDSTAHVEVRSFSTADGHELGAVNTLLPSNTIAVESGTANFAGLDYSRVHLPDTLTPDGAVASRRVLMDGTRLVVLARCGHLNEQACSGGSPPPSTAATVLLSYALSGPTGTSISLIAARPMSSNVSIFGMDATGAGDAVVVGSTTDGTSYVGPIESPPRTDAAGNERALASRNPLGNLLAPPPTPSVTSSAGFTPLSPTRVFDTRPGESQGAVAITKQTYGGANILRVKITGTTGVPTAGVGAVSLNV
ncbi:MAG: hypothetical protein JWL72_3683, partial [Ilumatobacteraceae bacterium]|nr:hypothetical protein [Ilumatobacteraceae bacterium]